MRENPFLNKWIIRVLKFSISALLIYYILKKAQLSNIIQAFKDLNPLMVLLPLALHPVGLVISTLRWNMLLKAQGIKISKWALIRSYLIGIFFNNISPGTIGGDIYRIYDISHQWRGSLEQVTSSVLVERALGFFVLFLFAFFAILLGSIQKDVSAYFWLVAALLGGVIFIAWIITSKTGRNIGNLVFRFPMLIKIRERAKKFHQAFLAYQHHKKEFFGAFLLSLLLQINFIFYYYLIGLSFGREMIQVKWLDYFVIIPIVSFIMLIPFTIGGIGIRENAFDLFFQPFNVSTSISVAYSWIDYGLRLFMSLIGGIIYAFSGVKVQEIDRSIPFNPRREPK